jgi:hypothetical protein
MTIDTRRVEQATPASAYPPIHRGDGWHTHPSASAAAFGCEVCDEEDRLELEQRTPLPEWARNGGGLAVRADGTSYSVGPGAARAFPDSRPADHEPELGACLATRTAHIHYAATIGYPRGYWPEEPSGGQRA